MNAVILSLDSNEKQSVICKRKHLTMKCMGAVESDSVKSPRKAKDKLHKCQKLMSELCMGRNKIMRMASMRQSRDSDRFSSQHTSTITCTAALRVWRFSPFHYVEN